MSKTTRVALDQISVCDQSREHFLSVKLINEILYIRICVATSGQELCFTKCRITPTVIEIFFYFLFANKINDIAFRLYSVKISHQRTDRIKRGIGENLINYGNVS
jgi:hypothetical protein